MNKTLILILDPNKDISKEIQIHSDLIIKDIKNFFAEKFRNEFSMENSESDILSYFFRNYSFGEITVSIEQDVLSHKEDMYILTGLDNIAVIEELRKSTGINVYVLAYTPNISKIENNQTFDKDILDIYLIADYYLNPYLEIKTVRNEFQRFLDLISGEPAVSIPRNEEINMYMAYTAMYNSHCLSRAVGACLTTQDHDIISTGWNDVPKAGGGVYGINHNNHCFKFKNPKISSELTPACHKDMENQNIMAEIREELKNQGIELGEKEEFIIKEIGKLQIKGLLEFSRSVHAEMHTIIKGAQMVGERIKDSILYVTAFPCHNCARHIILSGVRVVYFLEPFIKSRAIKLHNDSLLLANQITESDFKKDKVFLIPFQGVGGNGFEKIFKRSGDLKLKLKENKMYQF
jgi:deoxycytidylate deaminase